MTENRFKLDDFDSEVEMFELLNIQAEIISYLEQENEQLKQRVTDLNKLLKSETIGKSDGKITKVKTEEFIRICQENTKLEEENEQLKQTIKTIKKLCNQNRIPSLLTTYIPVNCEKKKGCLDNHMINAGNMGRSNIAKEILQLIDGDKDD